MKHTKSTITPFFVGLLGIALMSAASALADDEAKKTDVPKVDEEAKQQAPPSLDDLLGLEEDGTAEETAQRVVEEQLQQRLAGEQLSNAFQEAIANMRRSAELLDTSYDTGIGTQRIQQDVLTKLQQLIDDARRQQCSSSGSSQQQREQQQQQDPGRQQQRSQPQQSQAEDGSCEGDESDR